MVPKFPLTATEYYACNSVPSVESMKLIKIIEAKKGQNSRRSQLLIRLSALKGLESNYDL